MKEKMTFADLVEKIASETGVSKKLVHDLLIETVALNNEGLENDGHNSFPGLGRFSLKWHKARKGHNPRSGEIFEIPAHSTVNFNAKASLRNHINRKYALLQPELIETTKPEEIKKEAIDSAIKVKKAQQAVSTITSNEKTQEKKAPIQAPSEKPPFPPKNKHKKWWWLVLFLLILIISSVYLFWRSSSSINEDKSPTEKILISPQIEEKNATGEDAINERQKPVEEENAVESLTPTTAKKIEDTSPEKELKGIVASSYTIQQDDYLYRIAKSNYKKADFWPLIYSANRNQIPNPDILFPGKLITLPAIQGLAGNLSVQDKKDIAKGYMEAYLFYKDTDRNKAINYLWVAKKLNKDILKEYVNRINSGDIDSVNRFTGKLEL